MCKRTGATAAAAAPAKMNREKNRIFFAVAHRTTFLNKHK